MKIFRWGVSSPPDLREWWAARSTPSISAIIKF
jgi:hypothetical protein